MGKSLKKCKKRLKSRIADYERNLKGVGYTKPGSMKK